MGNENICWGIGCGCFVGSRFSGVLNYDCKCFFWCKFVFFWCLVVVFVNGDDSQMLEKDGFVLGEMFIVMVWCIVEFIVYEVIVIYVLMDIFIIYMDSYVSDGISVLESLMVMLDILLDIILDVGWNIIFSYVMLEDFVIDQIFSLVVMDVIIVKDGVGNFYIFIFNINDIGNWDML